MSFNTAETRTYVHNWSNVLHDRVGRVIDWSNGPIGEALRRLRADPFKEIEVNSELAEAVGDIHTREVAEFEWTNTYGDSTGKSA